VSLTSSKSSLQLPGPTSSEVCPRRAPCCRRIIDRQLLGTRGVAARVRARAVPGSVDKATNPREQGHSEAMETWQRCEASSAASPRWQPPRPGRAGSPARQVQPVAVSLPALLGTRPGLEAGQAYYHPSPLTQGQAGVNLWV
jgi:hypothetical protein